jgi:hypothetical protein
LTGENLGFGLWFWKPDVILEVFSRTEENDIILYMDAGCTLNLKNPEAIKKFLGYSNMAFKNGFFAMQLWDGEFDQKDLTDKFWGFSELNDLLNPCERDLNTNQIQAGILFVRNCEESRIFLENWKRIMLMENFRFLLGPKSKVYRYDQSIFSLLYKKAKYPTIPDETYFYPFWKRDGERFPIWATRINDGVDPFQLSLSDMVYRLRRKLMKSK